MDRGNQEAQTCRDMGIGPRHLRRLEFPRLGGGSDAKTFGSV